MSDPHHRIAVIGPHPGLGTFPSLLGLIQFLLESGYGVDVYCCHDDSFPSLEMPPGDLRTHIFPGKYHQGQAGWRIQFVAGWAPYLVGQYRRERYRAMIGIDPVGLLLATIVSQLSRVPVIYLSLELNFYQDMTSAYLRMLKILERWCNRRVAFTIVQDQDRANLLAAENRIPREQVVSLPNAPPGPARVEHTTTIRDALRIPSGTPIVLSMGNIGPATPSIELAQHANTWDFNAILVFHSRSRLNGAYSAAFRNQIDGVHTFLSDKLVASDQVRSLVSSADIGIALYRASEQERNVFAMGLSSGKIAHYLQCGLPVVATALPTVRRYVEGYRCGICVNEVEQVGDAVRAILRDYSTYSHNALDCFREEFELSKYLAPIGTKIDCLTSPT